jgi:uncharacterized repeat protein (TIGR02543 family)
LLISILDDFVEGKYRFVPEEDIEISLSIKKKHQVNYYNLDDQLISSETVLYDESPVSIPEDQSKLGYTFAGWFVDKDREKEVDTTYIVKTDIDVHPLFDINELTNVKISGLSTKVYDGNALDLELSFDHELLDTAVVTISWTKDGESIENSTKYLSLVNVLDSGLYKATITLNDNGVTTTSNVSVEVAISKAQISFTQDSVPTYNASEQTITLTIVGLQGNDTGSATVKKTNAGEEIVSVTHTIDTNNYIVPSTFTVSMDKAELTFGQPSTKPTYSGTEQTISLTINGLVGQDVNSGRTATVKMTNVNEADLNVTHNISEINYIVPSTFTVSMDKAEVTFGQPSTKPTYSGAEQTISLTINGLVGQDVNSGKTATVKMTNVNEADLSVDHNRFHMFFFHLQHSFSH